jgi:hypothetical protein
MARIAKPKPCPFCRGTDVWVECMDFGSFAATCNDCGAQGPNVDGDACDPDGENARGKRNAIRAWNGRARKSPARSEPKQEAA